MAHTLAGQNEAASVTHSGNIDYRSVSGKTLRILKDLIASNSNMQALRPINAKAKTSNPINNSNVMEVISTSIDHCESKIDVSVGNSKMVITDSESKMDTSDTNSSVGLDIDESNSSMKMDIARHSMHDSTTLNDALAALYANTPLASTKYRRPSRES